jgi:hypothetical protein
MGLKFRRGTTAQKSGSLAFGEPYVNTDLGTLQIGGASGDITLGASGTGSAGTFSSISASSLFVSGNANIGGNLTIGGAITIGDNVSDTVNVVASLSSSLIPSADNTFDLGSATKVWKDLYISTGSIKFVAGGAVVTTLDAASLQRVSSSAITYSQMLTHGIPTMDGSSTNNFTGSQFISGNINITGSIIPGVSNAYDLGDVNHFFRDLYISTGSIKMVSNGVVVSTLSNTGNGMLLDQGITAKGDSSFGTSSAAITSVTGSLNISGSVAVVGSLSASTINGIGNVTLYSSSVATRLAAAESFSSSLDSTFATDASVTSLSSSVKAVTDTFATSASVASATATSISTLSGSVKAVTDTFATSASVASATATSITTLSSSVAASGFAVSSSVASATATSISTLSGSVKAVTDTFATSASVASATATSISTLSSSVAASGFAVSSSVASATATSISTLSGSVKAVTDTFATSASLASARATDISTISSSVKAVTDTFATSASLASARATDISTISSSVKAVTDAVSGRVTTIEGKTLVSGSPQITGLSNAQLTNSSTTIGTTAIALGASATTIAGLTSVTSTTFVGALTGNASTVTTNANLTGDITSVGNATTIGATKVTNAMLAGSISNANLANSTISGKALGTNLDTLTISTGLSGTSYNGSAAITITNTGVTSNVAGAGIGVSGATGAVTITNNGVTSITGTANQVVASTSTGGVTLSLPQSIATTSAVAFASVSATGDIVAYSGSDKRLKNNIVNISDALNKVKQLNGVTWEWNDDANEVTKTAPTTGLIAQEVQEVLPEVVKEREDGYLGIDYSKMVGLLVEAIKEQQTQIAELKAEVEALKK